MKKAKLKKVVAAGIYLLEDGSYRVVARVGTKAHGTERRKEQRFPRNLAEDDGGVAGRSARGDAPRHPAARPGDVSG